MHAFLIVGNSEEKNREKAIEIANEKKALLIDMPLIKVEDAREIAKFLKLAPTQKTAIFIQHVDTSSTEAVNAFLKSLEEKEDFTFILTAKNEHRVLPTIVSRTRVILNGERGVEISKEALEFLEMKTSERLLFVEKLKTKEVAREFIEKLAITIDNQITLKKDARKLAKIAKQAIKTSEVLSSNANTFLTMANFVISL